VQLPQIAVIEKPANHVRRDLARALRVKSMCGRKLKPSIGAGQCSLETSMDPNVGGLAVPLPDPPRRPATISGAMTIADCNRYRSIHSCGKTLCFSGITVALLSVKVHSRAMMQPP
jgi:hypothetical protein